MFNVSIHEYFSILNVFIVCICNTTMFKLMPLCALKYCEPKMVPTVVLNPYFLSNSGFQIIHSIKMHKRSVGLGLGSS